MDLVPPSGSAPGFRHPHVVLQNNVFNKISLNTVVVCALTSNLKRAKAPGNVLISKGEANPKKDSVANISQVITVDRSDLAVKIGSLSPSSIKHIIEVIKMLIVPNDV